MLSLGQVFQPSFDTPDTRADVRAEERAVEQAAEPVRRGRLRATMHARATWMLLGLNVLVFVAMVAVGVDPLTPSANALLFFGASSPEAVLGYHQWWRVVSATFVHVGLVHLALNMWCLFNLGVIGEPLLGFFGMCSVYVLTGASGFLLSVAVNAYSQHGGVAAGASGAIFGIAGVLIVLFSNKKLAQPSPGFRGIPLEDLQAIRKSVISFAVLNLLIGVSTEVGPLMRSIHLEDVHIDNWAHIGGCISGLALAVPLVPAMTRGRQKYLDRQKLVFAGGALALALFGFFLSKLG